LHAFRLQFTALVTLHAISSRQSEKVEGPILLSSGSEPYRCIPLQFARESGVRWSNCGD